MPTNKEVEEVNIRVAQWKLILDEDFIKDKYNINFIFEKVNNVNRGIFATDYLKSHCAKWIGCTVFHFAVQKMNLEAVNILLSHGADFTIKNSSGSTALHELVEDKPNLILTACYPYNSFINSVISAHVKYGNFENPVNANGLSHFHIACAFNNVEVVEGFLQNGVSVDHAVRTDSPIFSGFTPLHFAAKNCALEVAKILLSHGADVQRKDTKGRLPVHIILEEKLANFSTICCNKTKIDKIDRLLELLSEKENTDGTMIADDWGLTYFHIACTLREPKIAASYLKKVPDVNHSVSMDSQLWPGYTALHFAAYCNVDLVELLMKNGADITIKNANGDTPFDICIEKYKAEDIYAVISWNPIWKNIMLSDGRTKLTDLVFAMRNPNQFNLFLQKISKNFSICNSLLWPGYTPLHLAVLFAKNPPSTSEDINVQILKYLCQHNPRMLYSKDVNGQTPLHLASCLNKETVIDLLLDFLNEATSITIDCIDEEGLSFMHIAAAENNITLLERMLSIGSKVNATYKGNSLIPRSVYPGSTALHFAVVHGSDEAAELLMKAGANVYAKDANNMTPIHLLLFDPGARVLLSSPDLRDSVVWGIGLSHLHVVCWYRDQPEIVERLLDLGADINGVITYQPNTNSSSSKLSFMEKYNGYTPLLMAYDECNCDNAKVLLKRGADIFAASIEGKALLYNILKQSSGNIFYEMFVETLASRIDMQRRLKAETGMTNLHIACLDPGNLGSIKKLINEGADVNAQIRTDSPIYKGYSPLHVVLYAAEDYEDDIVDRTIELLVQAGADVTLQTGNSETAVHMAWELIKDEPVGARSKYIRVNRLLEAQRNFSVNPSNIDGFSHFHIACAFCNTDIVQKFLRDGDVDIDQPINCFANDLPGYSGLHLAVGSPVQFCGVANQLRMVDLLLNHGAKVHVEDAGGNTPLHECAEFNCLDLFERLVRGGADMNARNVLGNAPLYCYLLRSKNATVEGLKLLLRFGCHLNDFNPITGEGYMAVAAWKFPPADVQSFLDAIMINFKQEMRPDDLGRTIIQNIVSTSLPRVSIPEYATFIGQLSEPDSDVDSQDHLGQIALHVAIKFHNFNGIVGLLMAGADVNRMDASGKTALACDFGTCSQCKFQAERIEEPGNENEDEKVCEHIQMKKALASHVKKLQYCGLDVNKQNEDLTCKTFEMYKIKTQWSEEFFEELEDMKNTKIGSCLLTLHDFMSENGAVADYPTMSLVKREAINKFFSLSERESLREKFPETSGILELQYRKALARPLLVESAKNAMTLLIGYRLPEICSHFILLLLKNSDLKSLISSTS